MNAKAGRSQKASDVCRIWRDDDLRLNLCQASITEHKFPKHAHDYYVIGLIANGRQSFIHRGTEYQTPPGGMITLNPEDDHTGVPVDDQGFSWSAIYPTRDQMKAAVDQLAHGKHANLAFPHVRVDDPVLIASFNRLYAALLNNRSTLVRQTAYVDFLIQLIIRHSNLRVRSTGSYSERWTVIKAKQLFRDHMSENLTLDQVASHLGIDRYRLTREFNQQLGMPPHLYLDCLRVREAQRLLEQRLPLADVAQAVGFSDQSHFTKRFKRQMGVTPGQYLR